MTTSTCKHGLPPENCADCRAAASKILSGLHSAADVAAGRPHDARFTFTAFSEFFVGGIRFAPGRYIIRCRLIDAHRTCAELDPTHTAMDGFVLDMIARNGD